MVIYANKRLCDLEKENSPKKEKIFMIYDHWYGEVQFVARPSICLVALISLT